MEEIRKNHEELRGATQGTLNWLYEILSDRMNDEEHDSLGLVIQAKTQEILAYLYETMYDRLTTEEQQEMGRRLQRIGEKLEKIV